MSRDRMAHPTWNPSSGRSTSEPKPRPKAHAVSRAQPAFQDHGRVETRLESELEEALYLFNQLHTAGVDYDDVVATLEREGIEVRRLLLRPPSGHRRQASASGGRVNQFELIVIGGGPTSARAITALRNLRASD
jgi:hypothetical protein